jgi:biotin-dependent carboxylase-like uncharacterized protein
VETFEVIHPGLLTTVQDLGRYGYQQYGVPVSGAMDCFALKVANLLLENAEGEACLEITLLGLRLQVLRDTVIAITGADISPMLNNNQLPMWSAVAVRNGDNISFPSPKSGCRSYLAVAGGINVPIVLGSRSTYVKSQLGGFEGRSLRSGDRLKSGNTNLKIFQRKLPSRYIPKYQNQNKLRVILGPQDNYFTNKGVQTFLNSEYTISIDADRVGYRLQGPRIMHKSGADIISDGIPNGAVQVPGNGLPIILLADRQTTGGYTKIATIITTDISILAQAQPGDKISFQQITTSSAHQALRESEKIISILKNRFDREYSDITTY